MSSVPNLFVFRADNVRRCTALLPLWPKAVIGSQGRSRYLWHVFAFDGEPQVSQSSTSLGEDFHKNNLNARKVIFDGNKNLLTKFILCRLSPRSE